MHRCTRGVGGEGVRLEKFDNKNEIKHEKGDPVDFLTTPSTPLKKIYPKSQGPPPPPHWISSYRASTSRWLLQIHVQEAINIPQKKNF
jgi:hypothetical protein